MQVGTYLNKRKELPNFSPLTINGQFDNNNILMISIATFLGKITSRALYKYIIFQLTLDNLL